MRITHFHNLAGVSTTLAKWQRRRGHEVSVLVPELHPFGYPGERSYGNFSMLTHGVKEVIWSGILHYHTGPYIMGRRRWYSRLSYGIDYRLARFLGRKILFHYHGEEIRERRRDETKPEFFREKSIVSTPDLLTQAPAGATWLPNPVDCEVFFPKPRNSSNTVRIGYYDPPSDYVRRFNKPEYVEKVLASQTGWRVEGIPAKGLPWAEMPDYFARLDLWIDKVNMSFYGMAACEAGACGIPIITQIGEDERTYVPDCPFIDLTHESLEEAIEYLLEENTRRYVGLKCLDYVRRTHEATRVVEELDRIYRSL